MVSNKTQHRKHNMFYVKMNILLQGFKTMFIATNGRILTEIIYWGEKKKR